ncbi:glycosyltransferase family 2 protein [Aquamicrobium defluvii]|uniref:glycosyltransferase family 2 protein n=1 Tax=Aquamicrobium defluvii TaxID=69279 RepID=UPI0004B543E8|nr:glycosyltransferase [Aquamicrobium defluvii]
MSPAPDLSNISIVVLSFNRGNTLGRNLIALAQMVEETGCELIVVDNASTDGSPEMIADILSGKTNTHFILNNSNLGVAGGRNTGWREATRDFILNIDDDTFITAEAVSTMRASIQRSARFGIVSPRILHAATGKVQLSFDDPDYRLANFHGACHLIRRAVLDVVGLNDENCTFGGEELDLSIRARAAGFDIAYVGDATVLHDNLVSKAEVGLERRKRWVYNFTRVFYKHFPLRAALPFSLRYLLSHVVSGVRAFGPGFGLTLTRAALHGCRDGRRQHKPVPPHVVRFYRNPDLRPEFGNRPLWRKLMKRRAPH